MNWKAIDWNSLERLRAVFLGGKAGATDYWQSESDLAGYDATFAQRIGWKWDYVLGEITRRGWSPPQGELLEWGCGSGIASRAFLDHFGPTSISKLHLFDRSSLAMQFAAKRAREKYPGLEVDVGLGSLKTLLPIHEPACGPAHAGKETQTPGIADPFDESTQDHSSPGRRPLSPLLRKERRGKGEEWSGSGVQCAKSFPENSLLGEDRHGFTLLISHVLTELTSEQTEALADFASRTTSVIWIEPGTHEASRMLIAIRERLHEKLHVIAPCTHQESCGLLAPENQRHWCHHFASPPAAAFTDGNWARFANMLGIDLRDLPLSFLVLDRRPGPRLPQGAARVIGHPRIYKAHALLLGCDAGGVRERKLTQRALPEEFRRWKKGKGDVLQIWRCDGDEIAETKALRIMTVTGRQPFD